MATAQAILARYRLLEPVRFTTGEAERAALWHLRKGLATRTGAMRPSGTAFLTEDVAVPVARLAEAIVDCQALFERHGVPDTVVFGHAKDGNLHFVLAEDVRSPEAIERYGAFMHGLVDLVVNKYDGAIKAEHGSGRNMAPFVKTEWGERAYAVMQRLKRAARPRGDPQPRRRPERRPARAPAQPEALPDDLAARRPLHGVRVLRAALPVARPHADAAPEDRGHAGDRPAACLRRARRARRRRRARLRLRVRRDHDLRRRLDVPGGLPGEDRHRRAREGAEGRRALAGGARPGAAPRSRTSRWCQPAPVPGSGPPPWPGALPLGPQLVELTTELLHAVAPTLLPHVPGLALPRPPRAAATGAAAAAAREPAARRRAVVYFPSCLTRMIGALPGETFAPTAVAMHDVLRWAGLAVRVPDGIDGLCCGMAFASKGFPEAARAAAARTAEALWRASDGGRLAVVTDASPCAGTLGELVAEVLRESGRAVRALDFPAFWAREVLPGLGETPRRKGTAILHPTCTLVKAGGVSDLLAVARAHAECLEVPRFAECCGFAGDRGFLVPELTASATAVEAAEIRRILEREPGAGCYSTCRTCEIGMSRAVGRPFGSLLHLVHEAVARA